MATLEKRLTDSPDSAREELERGSFARPLESQAQTRLVIATYNIRYAVGSFLITGSLLRRLHLKLPQRRARLVSRHISRASRALSDGTRLPRVDVLALQEADKQTARAGRLHVARELARELQMDYVHASLNLPRGEEAKSNQWYLDFEERLAPDETGDTGLATLSRFPFSEAARVDLPWTECAWRPRLAIETVIQVGKRKLHLFNAHIDPHASTDEKLEQHAAIIALAQRATEPTILLGDFNTLTSESRTRMRGLLESHGYVTPFKDGTATWRAGLIRLHTDWIFVRNARVTRWGVARRLGVSDHWPVWVELDLSDESEKRLDE
ncbi:MAG TPA: endonuclease/exonuclease/phosphatase family protein [Pyrinomonadaceae bacterium]|jgi:endonuclease/exonuclease/phosphatase family metal-dependent hydrolase